MVTITQASAFEKLKAHCTTAKTVTNLYQGKSEQVTFTSAK